jgi:succinoglycan biosynthesis transport protein ExoP
MNSSSSDNPLPGSRASKPFDIIGFGLRYGVIIVTLGLFVLTMLVPFVLKIKKPNFEVHAMLKIDPVIPSLITKSEDPSITGFYHDFVRTQAARISEFDVIAGAFKALTLQQRAALLPVHLTVEESVAILQKIISISPVSRTHLVKLSIQGPKKEALAPMLNALMATYLKKIQIEFEKKDLRRLSYLTSKKDSLKRDIQHKEQQLQEIAATVLSSSFAEDFNLWQKRVMELQKSYIHFYGDRIEAENDYRFEKKTAEELKQLPLAALVDEGVMTDRAIGFTSTWTYQQLQELRGSIDGVTQDNFDRQLVEQRMEAMRDYEKTLREETRNTIDSIVYGKRDIELQQSLIKKHNRYQEALASEQQIMEALSEAEDASGSNSSALLHGASLKTDLDHARDLLFRIDTRIHELEAEARAPLRVTIESLAKEPKNPAGSNIKKLLMACVALSFGSVGGAFLLIEFFDNRIRSSKAIIQALGHPPTWPISAAPSGVAFNSVLSTAPTSATSKALRSLATRIYREHEERQAQIFLFTAVDSCSGTTEITHNTAQALAYKSSQVLVVDATVQQWDTAEGEIGQEDCEDPCDPLKAIQHDHERGVDYLVSFMPLKPDRFTARTLNRLLKEARKHYNFICIDSAPVLQSDLTEHLAANSDVGILIIQGDSSEFRAVKQSAEILVRLDIPALAPVLNWGGKKIQPWFEKYLDAIPEKLRNYRHKNFKSE